MFLECIRYDHAFVKRLHRGKAVVEKKKAIAAKMKNGKQVLTRSKAKVKTLGARKSSVKGQATKPYRAKRS